MKEIKTFKRYPEKTPPPPTKYNVCLCGHFEHNHNHMFKGFFGTKMTYIDCEKCMCPEYSLLQKMTWDEWYELEQKERKENAS